MNKTEMANLILEELSKWQHDINRVWQALGGMTEEDRAEIERIKLTQHGRDHLRQEEER